MLILQTPRLRLRWFAQSDAGFMRRLLNDPGWIANIGDRGVHTRAILGVDRLPRNHSVALVASFTIK